MFKDMIFQATLWIIVALMGIFIFLIPLIRRFTAKKLTIFHATVVDKRINTVIAYTGLFIPIEEHFLILDRGGEVKVSPSEYRMIGIGDIVTVSEYSDKSLRLEQTLPSNLTSVHSCL